MSVDEAERRLLALEMNEDARQDGVLEDVGEIAGMKGVAVIHESPKSAAKIRGTNRSLRVQRTGATAIEPRWQLCRATLRQIA